jgi:circadian clock protein KaiB
MKKTGATQNALERAAAARDHARYVLRLYVTGTTPSSTRAIVNIRRLCEEHLRGRYELEVIDITQHPTLVAGFVGDMSQTERILLGLDLRPA